MALSISSLFLFAFFFLHLRIFVSLNAKKNIRIFFLLMEERMMRTTIKDENVVNFFWPLFCVSTLTCQRSSRSMVLPGFYWVLLGFPEFSLGIIGF